KAVAKSGHSCPGRGRTELRSGAVRLGQRQRGVRGGRQAAVGAVVQVEVARVAVVADQAVSNSVVDRTGQRHTGGRLEAGGGQRGQRGGVVATIGDGRLFSGRGVAEVRLRLGVVALLALAEEDRDRDRGEDADDDDHDEEFDEGEATLTLLT